jgi:hypothetical protein
MGRRFRFGVEPVLGWIFVVLVIAVLGVVVLVVTRPRGDVIGHFPVRQSQ